MLFFAVAECCLPFASTVTGVHTINLLGYHGSHEARSRMKSVGLLRVRDDLIRRCLFHPTAASWETVSALSQVGAVVATAPAWLLARLLATPPSAPFVMCRAPLPCTMYKRQTDHDVVQTCVTVIIAPTVLTRRKVSRVSSHLSAAAGRCRGRQL